MPLDARRTSGGLPVSRGHLDALRAPEGVYQFARGSAPDPAHGTCTDDVARALVVDVLQAGAGAGERALADARCDLSYLREAFIPSTGRFRNLRDADGRWLDAVGSARDSLASRSIAISASKSSADSNAR